MSNTGVFPLISRKQFIRNLRKRAFEDVRAVNTIERYLQNVRGFVFRFPKPGTPVILMVSGGLDSTVTWKLLLETYKLKVYPLFIFRDRQRSKKEFASVRFFYRSFHREYPNLCMPVMKFSTILSPLELVNAMKNKRAYYHPKRILDIYGDIDKLNDPNFYPQRVLPFLHFYYALAYAQYLYDHNNLRVNTVITAILAGDGIVVPSQAFTSLRAALLSACFVTNNYNWQYISLPMEKELGHWWYKRDVIKIGHDLGLPLERTWTCYNTLLFQCGVCVTCKNRRQDFYGAGVSDKTWYMNTNSLLSRIMKLQNMMPRW